MKGPLGGGVNSMLDNIDAFSEFALKLANGLIMITGGRVAVFLGIAVVAVLFHALLDNQWYKRGGFFINSLSFLSFITIFVGFGFAAYLYIYPYQAT
jgi:hypothetical protein